ncbi:hypothetical protein [Erythrobacter sp. BLCC-B19]|uniref:hypothetical protein n=1 Tax=Erythrobacter sp. BLCC-B19 TaxID=3025315 RepID=UPI00235E8C02|nr:hypothetical protein [Erythrobacter sp. BLCC-B19]WDA42614.1 hypothetical protein PS060_07340 [Erythrobacter sp. BLCC-B19]
MTRISTLVKKIVSFKMEALGHPLDIAAGRLGEILWAIGTDSAASAARHRAWVPIEA